MQRILQITTYDVEVPDHGGKLRSHHIRESLRSAYDVQTLSIEWGDEERTDGLSVVLAQAKMAELKLNGWLIDLGILSYLEAFPTIYSAICEAVRSYAPDIVLVEQPYPWPIVERMIEDGTLNAGTRKIYSSHNVEIDMKRKFYADLFTPEEAQEHGNRIERIEQTAICDCDVMLCTTQLDYDFSQAFNTQAPARIFKNGHRLAPAPQAALDDWQARFASASKNVMFVGSMHPPNINGLRDLLAALPSDFAQTDTKIWVLGGVGPALAGMSNFDPAAQPYVKLVGFVDATDIDAALELSDAILLPIWEGSGSNLKTAQALLTDKTVIASTFSFRGFEEFTQVPGALVVKEPKDLARALSALTPGARFDRAAEVQGLTWEVTLADLNAFVDQSLAGNNGSQS